MAEKFKLGEVVRLKSGGPPMTVDDPDVKHYTGNSTGKVGTVWFAGAKKESGNFDPETLEKVEPKAALGE